MAYRLRATLRQGQPVILSRSVNWKTLTAWAAWAWVVWEWAEWAWVVWAWAVWAWAAWGTEATAAAEIHSPRSQCPADTPVRLDWLDSAEVVYTEGVALTEGGVCTEGTARYWGVGPFQAARSEPVPYP